MWEDLRSKFFFPKLFELKNGMFVHPFTGTYFLFFWVSPPLEAGRGIFGGSAT